MTPHRTIMKRLFARLAVAVLLAVPAVHVSSAAGCPVCVGLVPDALVPAHPREIEVAVALADGARAGHWTIDSNTVGNRLDSTRWRRLDAFAHLLSNAISQSDPSAAPVQVLHLYMIDTGKLVQYEIVPGNRPKRIGIEAGDAVSQPDFVVVTGECVVMPIIDEALDFASLRATTAMLWERRVSQ